MGGHLETMPPMPIASAFAKMPVQEKSLLRESIVATSRKPHPSKEDLMGDLMGEHMARMEQARSRLAAQEAQEEASRARLAASMEAKKCDQLRGLLAQERAENAAMRADRESFVSMLNVMQREKGSLESKGEDLMSLYIVVKDELDSARTQMEAVEREREEQRALMLAVFKEKEETEFQLAAMKQQMDTDRARAQEELGKLIRSRQKVDRKHEKALSAAKREYDDLHVKLAVAVEECESSNTELRQLQDSTDTQIFELKQALAAQVVQTQTGSKVIERLENELESLRKTIWLRKYDPMSPRSPARSHLVANDSPGALQL